MAVVGPKVDLTYEYEHLGDSTTVLEQLADGIHPYCEVSEPHTFSRSTSICKFCCPHTFCKRIMVHINSLSLVVPFQCIRSVIHIHFIKLIAYTHTLRLMVLIFYVRSAVHIHSVMLLTIHIMLDGQCNDIHSFGQLSTSIHLPSSSQWSTSSILQGLLLTTIP